MDFHLRPRRQEIRWAIAACIFLVLCNSTLAQIAGNNVNMVSGTQWPGGDPFLQRQNEPSIAVSSRNPFHLLAGANDYRSVDLALTTNGETGDAWLGLFKSLDGGATWRSILLPGCPYNTPICAGAPAVQSGGYAAAADPTVRAGSNGMFYYSGLVFNRGLNPSSAIIVSRLIDLNNKENADPNDILNGDSIQYVSTSVVATGTPSSFLDKPTMAVDIPRWGAPTCNLSVNQPGNGVLNQLFAAGNVYVTYTAFQEAPNTDPENVAGPQPSKLYFVRSTNCGATWSKPLAISGNIAINQGTSIAIDPTLGTIYVAWREFQYQSGNINQPDAIVMTASFDGGRNFTPPLRISTFTPFDEGTTNTSFRTNAYPTITVDNSSRVYVAYAARNTVPSGDARIVLTDSFLGLIWSKPVSIDNPPIDPILNPSGRGHQIMPALTFAGGKLSLLYYDLRLDHTYGLYTPLLNLSQPTGLYSETPELAGELALNPPDINAVFNLFIDDSTITIRRHTFDLRMTQALPGKEPVFAPSIPISQYSYGCCAANQTDIEQMEFNAPNLPLFKSGTAPFMGDYVDLAAGPTVLPPTSKPSLDDPDGDADDWHFNTSANTPTTFHAAWTDNRDVQPPADGDWTHYTPPISPSLGTTSIFEPGTAVPACQPGFTGSRNQNIYTAPISGGLIFGAPSNAKTLGTTVFNGNTVPFQRAFVVVAQNTTEVVKSFRLSVTNQPPGGSASFLQFSLLTTLDLSIPPMSSASRPVFVVSTDPTASVTINIAEIAAPQGTLVPNGLTGSTTLNPDATNPGITNPTETIPGITNPGITNFEVTNPGITNPGITNPTVTNPGITNPGITNPGITNSTFQNETVVNPGITNPGITNPGITNASIANPGITNPGITNVNPANVSISDTQWTVVNNGNTTGAYTVNLASSSTVPQGNVLQLIISKLYQTPAAPTGQSCNLAVETHNVIVTNIVNPVVLSPTNPGITNPGITNPGITNATVSLAPGETANIDIRVVNTDIHAFPTFNAASSILPVVVSQSVNTQQALASGGSGTTPTPPISVPPLIITTTTLADGVFGSVYTASIITQGGNPTAHTFSVNGTLPSGLTLNAGTGAIAGIPTTVGSFTFTIQVQDVGSTLFSQHTATQTLTIRIAAPLVVVPPIAPPSGGQGAPYSQTITTTGGTPPITFTLFSGALPPGLTLQSNGTITGVPTGTGTFNFIIQATDSLSPPQVTLQSFTIMIVAGTGTPQTLTFVAQPQNSIEGQLLANSPIQVLAVDVTGAPVANANVGMTLAGTPPCSTAALAGTVPQATNGSGIASFSDLNINRGQAGFSLLATAGNATTTSNLFNVEGYCDTGSMNAARHNHQVITLLNGKVLVAGGAVNPNSSGALASAELYDPATHTFTTVGSMNAARVDFTTTLLPNGQVLVTGGFNDTTINSSAELFDPSTNTFTLLTGTMSDARSEHVATLLANGKVLITGGNDLTGNSLATAEIFDPATNTFTPTTHSMSAVRQIHHADLLPNGQVLVEGGFDTNGNPLASAELYNPVIDTFTLTGSMNTARGNHGTALLYSGQMLVAGGLVASGTSLALTATAELYDPATGKFTPTGNMSIPRGHYTMPVLADGTVFNQGGATLPAGTNADIYNPATGTFRVTGNFTTEQTGLREGELLDGTVLLAGGVNSSTVVVPNSEIFYPIGPPTSITITTTVLGNAIQDQPYTQLLLEKGGIGTLLWTQASGELPPGITLGTSGILIGTPTAAGTFSFTAQVADSATPQKTATSGTLTITVTGVPLQFTSNGLPTAGAGRFYSQPLPIIGGTQPYTVTQTAGTLPPGLSISSNGVLEGTPSAAGSFTFTVQATDSSAPQQTATQTFTIAINTLFITTTVLPDGVVGVPYNAAISTSGGTLPLSFSVTTASFPPGLLIQQPAPTSQNGALAGTPTQAGTFEFSESVVDSSNPRQTATQNYVVTIAPAGTAAPAGVTFVTQPQPSIGGQILSGGPITVRVADASNTPIAGTLVALSFNGAPPCSNAILSGTLSAVTGSNGQASFSDLSVDRGQFGYTLLASAGSASAVSATFRVQGFCASGNLSTQREGHTQDGLGSGKVLIAGGGDNNGNALNTAELYDPATGTNSPTGNLTDPNGRADHVSAVLANGQVLLAGGSSNVSNLATAEVYDPAAGTFTATGSMSQARYYAAAVLLADGRVLVSGGFDNNNVASSRAEIYDPTTGLFTRTADLNQPRGRHTMTLLPNGKVLVTGGRDAQDNFFSLASAEIFDPFANQGAGAFTLIGNMNSPRSVHTATLLSNGTVLIAGGFNDGNTSLSVTSAETFDPSTNVFTPTGSMSIPRARQTSTLLPDGTVLEAGGIDSFLGVSAPAPSEIYSPTSGLFRLTGAMITGRELPRATPLLNGNALVTGGDDGVNVLASTELYYNTVPLAPIVITTASVPNGFISQPYVQLLLQQNGTGPIAWSLASGTLPPGITLGANGLLTGTPTATGTFTFTVQVTDGHSVASGSITINVSLTTLAFTSSTVPQAGVGRAYSQALPVIGGTLPYTATLTGGSLPAGLALSSNGVLSGTPSSPGSFSFTVNVTDSSTPTQSATQTLTMAVDSLFITTTALPDGILGVPYNATITASGGTLPLNFSSATSAFPTGLSIQPLAANQHSVGLGGTPTLAGHYTFIESVSDSSNPVQTATQYYTMDVLPAGTAVPATVTFLSQPQNSVGGQILVGSPVRVQVTDANNVPIVGASVALSFNGAPPCSTAVLSGTLNVITNGAGNAGFSDLSIDRGQLGYSLLASAGSASAISQPFNIEGFCDTGSMATARALLNSVALLNGKVLIAGGAPSFSNQAVAFSSAELYDPVAHSFTPVGSMHSGRSGISMALLQNGLVLLAGGFNGSAYLSSAELFDPATNTFTLLAGSMVTARDGGIATLLANGKVLITGGSLNGTVLASAEIFDPVTNTFTATSLPMTTPRELHEAVLLPNGKVLITGGFATFATSGPSNPSASAELYDPVTDTFTSTGSMAMPRYEHASALLFTGKVLVSGGFTANNFSVPLATAEIYDPSTGAFSSTATATQASAGYLSPVPVLPDGTVFLYAGANAQIYDPTLSTFRVTGNTTAIQAQPVTSLLDDGTVLVTGGVGSPTFNTGVANAEIFYPFSNPSSISITTTSLQNGVATKPYTQMLLEEGGLGNLTWSETGALPTGITLSPQGILSGTPSVTGSFPITVTATDSSSPAKTGSASFVFVVASALQFTATQMPSALSGVAYSQLLPVSGGVPPYTSSAGTGLPAGLSLNSTTGIISGTTTALGTFTFTATVTDSFAPPQMATQTLTLVVVAPLAITTTTLPNGTVAAPYSATISTTGGSGTVSFAVSAGALPAGLTLSTSGVLSGTPTAGGTFSFTVIATDQTFPPQLAPQAYTVTIAGNTGVPAHVTFVAQPQNAIASQPMESPIQVQVSDANFAALPGVLVTLGFNGTPACSNATINGVSSQTATTDSTGTAIFSGPTNITIDRGHINYTLAATAGTVNAVSTPFNVEGFCSTATPSSTRYGATATLLQSGKVLLAGGQDATVGVVATAEIYDPVAGTMTATGSMSSARLYATATLLNDGTVLMTGGTSSALATPFSQPSSALSSAEIYNPATGQFTLLTSSMSSVRVGHTAALLLDGTVLIAGGFTGGSTGVKLNTAELYNPTSQTFTPLVATMTDNREAFTATLLTNGKVLLAGGLGSSGQSRSTAELYDPFAKMFTATLPMVFPHAQHAAALLLGGQVAILGGVGSGATAFPENAIELFDPSSSSFSLANAALSPTARVFHSATALADGRVLVDGGFDFNRNAQPSAEILDSSLLVSIPESDMQFARAGATATLLQNETVLFAGGAYSGPQGSQTLSTLPAEIFYPADFLPFSITTTSDIVTLNSPFSFQLRAIDGTGTLTWQVTSGSLPAGVTLSQTGLLSGTPTASGSFSFSVQVTDSATPSNSTTGTFFLFVSAPQLSIPSILPDANPGVAYNQPIFVSGGTAPYTFTQISGALPSGLTLSGAGVVSGTTTPTGTFTFTVQVTDSSALAVSAVQTIKMSVAPPLAITTTTLPNGIVGTAYSASITTTGGLAPLSFFGGNLPPGLTLSATGVLSGTPTTSGTFAIEVQVSDFSASPQTAFQFYTMIVSGTPVASMRFVNLGSQFVSSNIVTASVLALDASNNPIPNTQITVAVGKNTCPAEGSSPNSAVTDVTGTAAFSIDILGGGFGYTLTATSFNNITVTSGTFNVAGSCDGSTPNAAHYGATTTVLNNGLVLVAGGQDSPLGNPAVATAELYDPVAAKFTLTGSMTVARAFHTATLLPNGNVLVVGGLSQVEPSNVPLASVEVYNPTSGTFASLGSMSVARFNHAATLLPDGTVLVAGGNNGSGAVTSAEIINPTLGTFTLLSNSMNAAREQATATLLANGTVLIAGGLDMPRTVPPGLPSAEIYNPTNRSFTLTASMNSGHAGHTATLLTTGKVLIAGGENVSVVGEASNLTITELYDPSTGTFSLTGPMSAGRAFHTATLLQDNKVLVAGGDFSFGFIGGSNFEVYDPSTGNFTAAGAQLFSRASHGAALLNNGTILLVGGSLFTEPSEIYFPPVYPLIFLTAALPSGLSGTAYNVSILTTGGFAPVTFQVTSGSLPPGLTLNTQGVLSGVPSSSGTFTFNVTATDSSTPAKDSFSPQSATQLFTVRVN